MCMTVSVFCLSTIMSMHDSCQDTFEHTCRDHSHTLERRWWRVWRWFALAPHTIIHTNMHTCACMRGYVCIYIIVFSLFPFLSMTDNWLPNSLFLLDTGIFIWTTTSCRPCHPAFLPGFHRFSECVCFSWLCTECCAWVKVLNVCEWVCVRTSEGTWQLFDLTSNPCCTWIRPQDCIYKHEYTRTYMYRQTERHSRRISEIAAAHTLAHVVHTRTPFLSSRARSLWRDHSPPL
jgi:hypothetical protein